VECDLNSTKENEERIGELEKNRVSYHLSVRLGNHEVLDKSGILMSLENHRESRNSKISI
jgi:hypothetical protein